MAIISVRDLLAVMKPRFGILGPCGVRGAFQTTPCAIPAFRCIGWTGEHCTVHEPTSATKKIKACILFLVYGKAEFMDDMFYTLPRLDKFFNDKHNYPVVIFHSESMKGRLDEIKRLDDAPAPLGPVTCHPIGGVFRFGALCAPTTHWSNGAVPSTNRATTASSSDQSLVKRHLFLP